jgi:hypothetical protein
VAVVAIAAVHMAVVRMVVARMVLAAGMVVVCTAVVCTAVVRTVLEVGANPVQGLDHLFLESMVMSYYQTGRTSSHLLSVGNLDS